MKDKTWTVGKNDLGQSFGRSARPVVTVDVEKYQAFLDEADLSEAQKEEFLQAVWSIIVSFVDWGFGVHPLQEVCGKTDPPGEERPREAFDKVRSPEPDQERAQSESRPAGGLEAE